MIKSRANIDILAMYARHMNAGAAVLDNGLAVMGDKRK